MAGKGFHSWLSSPFFSRAGVELDLIMFSLVSSQ